MSEKRRNKRGKPQCSSSQYISWPKTHCNVILFPVNYVDKIVLYVNQNLFSWKKAPHEKVGNPGYRCPGLDTSDYEHTTSYNVTVDNFLTDIWHFKN